MKKLAIILSMVSMLYFVSSAWGDDKETITMNVETVAAGIESGKDASSYKAEDFVPYVFILEESGNVLVHPSLVGESMQEKAPTAFEALQAATPEGVWVQYESEGKMMNVFAKKTSNNLIIGCGN